MNIYFYKISRLFCSHIVPVPCLTFVFFCCWQKKSWLHQGKFQAIWSEGKKNVLPLLFKDNVSTNVLEGNNAFHHIIASLFTGATWKLILPIPLILPPSCDIVHSSIQKLFSNICIQEDKNQFCIKYFPFIIQSLLIILMIASN